MGKYQVLLLALTLSLLFCDALANKPRKFKKFRKHKSQTHGESREVFDGVTEDEKQPEELKRLESENAIQEEPNRGEEDEKSVNGNYLMMFEDPCADKHCGAGRVCEVTPEGKAACVCIPSCNRETDPRRKVCSNHNETWNSDCEVYQMRCWCEHQNENCLGEDYKHVHINYYGPCKQLPPCTEDEMADFPRRMRDWLFNIMRDMADRNALSEHYLKMEREAESNYTRKWINSAIWKWCDLDEHPHDRSVSRHELFPIKAPLMALEHCIAPFLDKCDDNNDHRITLKEWGKCLELPEDELEEQCDEIREE